jgi:glucose-6-phosphate dehydrogenase assembly protein OpcA
MPAVYAERILRELTELWASLAKENSKTPAAQASVLRACSMTLIVATENEADTVDVEQALAELMHEHPSRAIVLKPAGSGGGLDSRVFAQCWMPFGSRQQICCEEIEIATPDDELHQASRVILGLLAPDLPAVLWCRGDRWFERAGFEQLYPLIRKLVVDSCSFAGAANAFELLDVLRGKGPILADLAWTRLTAWRQMIANAFEGPGAKLIGAVREIVLEYYGDAPSVAVLYFGAWLRRAIPAASVTMQRVAGELGQVAGVQLKGDGVDVRFRRAEGDAVQVSGTAHMQTVMLPHANEARSMQEELSITGRDPVFEEVFRAASALTRAR